MSDGDAGIPDNRNPDGTWVKGKSPNPGGRPPWLTKIRKELKELLPGAKDRLEGIIRDGEDKDSVAAMRLLFDFTLPKPTQKHKVTGRVDNPLAGMTTEQLLEWGRNLKEAKKEGK